MSPEERILAVFEKKPKDRIPWNIRHECWYFTNKAKGTLKPVYANMGLSDVCKELGASWRCYSGYYVENAFKVRFDSEVDVKVRRDGREVTTIIEALKRFVRRITSMFPENLVLGISDELPPPADESRVRRVSEILEEEV